MKRNYMKRDLRCGTINHWKVLLLSCLVSVFVCFAFVSTSVFAEEMDDSSLKSSSSATRAAYRLYNPYTGEHFFTLDSSEYKNLGKVGWNQEGTAWIAPAKSDTPVYRLYNPYSGDHHFTTDKSEYDHLGKIGWRQENIGWYSDDSNGVAVYRLYNPYATVGTHHFTSDKSEYDKLPSYGWRAESIAWYGVASITYSTKQAYAAYSADDQSLNFYKRTTVPGQGSKFEGKTATQVFMGIENMPGVHYSDVWEGFSDDLAWPGWHYFMYRGLIKTAAIIDDGIQPKNMDYWFGQWKAMRVIKLERIDNLEKLDTSKTTSMNALFYGSYLLTSLDLSSWDTSKVENMGDMFMYCDGLQSINVANWNTSKVNDMFQMFCCCDSLKYLNLSKWDTSQVTNMQAMFDYCESLTADCSKWNVSKVTSHKNFNYKAPGVITPKWVS